MSAAILAIWKEVVFADGARGFVFADRVVSSLTTERDLLRLCGT